MRPEKQTAQERELLSGETNESVTDLDNPATESTQEVLEEWEIDWENDPAVILHDQAATAAYYNNFGELVVKQRDTLGTGATLFVTRENVALFLEGLVARATPSKGLKVVKS